MSQAPSDQGEMSGDGHPDPIIALTTDGRIRSWNRAAARLFGFAPEQVVGRSFEVLVVPPPDRERFRRHLAEALEHGRALMELVVSDRSEGKPASVIVAMRVLRDEGVPELIAIVCAAVTPTTRQGRWAGEQLFLGLLDSVSDAVIITGEDGRIVIVNDRTEELFGYTPDELLGQSLDRLLPAKLGRRKDGSEFPVEIRANRIHIDDGVLMATAVQDIGDRVHRQTAVRLATQELEAIGQSVAHDLRVPVREIEAYGQVILDEHGEKLEAAGVDCVHEIRARAGEMRSMLDALASLTQVTRQELVPEPIDLTAMAKTIAAELAAAEPKRKVEVVIADDLRAYADRGLARILVFNLLDNAWKFTRTTPAPRIEVGRAQRDGVRELFVRDNGIGFPMAHVGRLFVPFRTLHPAGEWFGRGIGLATARRIVHHYGGNIRAESKVRKGASFYFTLPAEPTAR